MLSLCGGCKDETDKQPKLTIDPTKQRTFDVETMATGNNSGSKAPAVLQPAQRDSKVK
jgi:hypothetical protein